MLELVYTVGRCLPKSLRIKDLAIRMGFNTTDWVRVVMYQECNAFIESIGPEAIDVLEISGVRNGDRGSSLGHIPPLVFPNFDICAEVVDRQFDLIIADQV